MSKEKITLTNYINSNSATSPDQGDSVYKEIKPIINSYIDSNTEFAIDLKEINILTTAFLNNAIGKLFYDFDKNKLLSLMSFTGISNTIQVKTLKLTLSNAIALSEVKDS